MQRAAQRFLEDSMSDAIVKDLLLEEGDSARVDLVRIKTDGTCYVDINPAREGERLVVAIEDGSDGIGSGVPIMKRRMKGTNGKVGLETEAMRFVRQKPSDKIQ